MNPFAKHIKEKKSFNLKRYLIAQKEKRPNPIKGGRGDNLTEKDVDSKELEWGIEIEKEHSPKKNIRKDISFDHLEEDDKYYTHLREMEKKYEKKSFNLKEYIIAKKKENVNYVECPKDCGNSGSMGYAFELEVEDGKTWVPKKRLKEYNKTCKDIKEDLKAFNLRKYLIAKKRIRIERSKQDRLGPKQDGTGPRKDGTGPGGCTPCLKEKKRKTKNLINETVEPFKR